MAQFIDNSPEFIERMQKACEAALEALGNQAVSHAKKNITEDIPRNAGSWSTPTGALKNSISHMAKPDENTVYVGTNLSYAKYNEYGTGVYADNGNGKQGFWVFVPDASKEGTSVGGAKVYTEAQARRIVAMLKAKGLDAHMTKGMKPIHFLKRAIEEHSDEYYSIIQKFISKA